MRSHLPWLGQGDIFRDAPVLDVTLGLDGVLAAELPLGPAVLLTHDCAMDKPDRTGRPRAERLQFGRLRSTQDLPNDYLRTLRGQADQIFPVEAVHLGDVGDFGESFLLLSDPYFVPAAFFALELDDYSKHPEGGGDGSRYATPGRNDSRIGRLTTDRLSLLRRKMIAFWTRLEPAAS